MSRYTRAKKGSQEASARDLLVFGSLLGQIFLLSQDEVEVFTKEAPQERRGKENLGQ